MAILQQSPTSDTLYIGWYGTCPENEGNDGFSGNCTKFTLVESVDGSDSPTSWRHSIFPESLSEVPSPANGFNVGQSEFFRSVKEVNNLSGALTAYDGTTSQAFGLAGLQVKELVCGRSYYITLKPGNKSLDIPEFQFANQATSSYEYRIADSCAPVTELEKLWISFTGNDHYSDWYELETDEVDDFTKFKITTPNYGTDLYNWANGKVTNLQGILMTASETKPDSTSLTTEQKAKTRSENSHAHRAGRSSHSKNGSPRNGFKPLVVSGETNHQYSYSIRKSRSFF